MSGRVQRVVIVGRDAACWMAAIGIRRSLGRTGVSVEVVELGSLLDEVDAYVAVPSIRALHRMLGLDEAAVLRGCSGVPMAAQRFSGWSKSRSAFFHGYDIPLPPGKDLDFAQYWLKARGEGLRVPYEDFLLSAAAAKQGRVPVSRPDAGDVAAAAGVQFHARAYAAMLRHVALTHGVLHRPARAVTAEVEGDRIARVVTEAGERIEADLFVDASGAEAVLIGRMPGAEFESWRRWLPCDRIISASSPRLNPLPAFSQISAFRAGWVGLYPLQHRTAIVAVFESSTMSEREVLENLQVLAGVPIQGDALLAKMEAGAQRRPWIGNCVAIGEAAVRVDQLDAVHLHLAHVGVSHLITLFPVEAAAMPEADAFNAAMLAHARNARDFQAAHYKLNKRYDEPFWDRVREAEAPETLEPKLRLFAARGQLILYDDEAFQEQNWY
ncbi:MAG TPA: tryptophan 7-halogenase, partial [Allosphingosinicella sp.]